MPKAKATTSSTLSLILSIFLIFFSFGSGLLLLTGHGIDPNVAKSGKEIHAIWDVFAFWAQFTCVASIPSSILMLIVNILLRKRGEYLYSSLLILPGIFVNIIPYILFVLMLLSSGYE